MQQLEDRRLLAVLSQPSQELPVVSEPVAVGLGTFNADLSYDAIAINAAGDATLATGGETGDWQTIGPLPTNFGSLHSVVAERLTADPLTDLITVSSDTIQVWHNDNTGDFSVVQTLDAPTPGGFTSPLTVANTLEVDFVDAGPLLDLVAVAPGDDAVLVYRGNQGGTFGDPTTYSTGIDSPTTAVVADVIGGPLPDLVVGHLDGSIVFFEGTTVGTDSTLVRRDELTITESNSIVDLVEGDFDGDGNSDIVVTTASDAFVLFSNDDPQGTSPVANGDFSSGLTGWSTEIVGHTATQTPGRINGRGGAAQFTENESFLTALKQTIVIPAGATSLSFDLVALGLDPIAGGVPDAFEVSLLDANEQSVVPTHDADSTAFFNVSSGSAASLASGVSVSGSTVTLDVASLQPEISATETSVTLVFDLIGNTPGDSSVATIDNVRLTPDTVFSDQLDRVSLVGTYGGLVDAEVGDVDGDGNADIVFSSTATQSIAVFNGDGIGGFSEDSISLSAYASPPGDIALAPLTPGDLVDDIVVVMPGENLILSPLGADVTAPAVTLLTPDTATPLETFDGSFTIEFSEPVRETGLGSVNNAGAYSLVGEGADGVLGTADDVSIAIESVSYDAATLVASISVAAAALPLADGNYRLTISGEDSATAIRDLVGNAVGGGNDVTFDLQVDAPLTVAALPSLTVAEGTPATLTTTFNDAGLVGGYTAVVDWGDGTQSSAIVTADASGFAGSITADHVYADNGSYSVTLTLTDAQGEEAEVATTAMVSNADPVLTNLNDLSVAENTLGTFTLASVSDAGFAFASGVETFSATIDWGDGTAVTTVANLNELTSGPTGPTTADLVADHVYATEGVYAVTITVTDDDGGSVTGTLQAFVSNTAPILAPIESFSAGEGELVTVSGTYTDDDLLGGIDPATAGTVTIDWGDGSTQTLTPTSAGGNQAAFTADHTYADDGDYTVRVSVADNDSGMASQTATASISGLAPVVSAAAGPDVVAGQTTTIALASFSDAGFTNSAAGTEETFTVSVDWGDGSAITIDPSVVVTDGSPGIATTGLVSADHAFASPGTYTVTITVTDDDGLSSQDSLQVRVNSDDPTGACLPNLHFDIGLTGNSLPAGTIVTDQWSLWGVNVTTDDPTNHPAMIFDSANPTGGDSDLAGTFGNVLIISEDGDSSDPDDNAAGGTLIFDFDTAVQLDEVSLLDIDLDETSTMTLFDASGAVISAVNTDGTGNNSLQTISLDADNVARMEIQLSGSGAVTDITFCRDLPTVILSGEATATEGIPYNVLSLSPDVSVTSWQINFSDETSETLAGDAPTTTKTFADGPDTATISGWATDGKNVYLAQPLSVVIDNVIPTLTIAGEATIEARVGYTLDLSAIDPGQDTIAGWVVDWGDGTLQQIAGNPDSVSHVYEAEGQYAVIAHAFDEDYVGPTVGTSSPIEVVARGQEGGETFDVLVDDVVIGSGTATTDLQTFAFVATGAVAASQIKIQFTNDVYDPSNGIDRNLIVDYITVRGETFQTEADDVYSTGTWKPADGVVPGYRNSEWMHSGGYFQFDADANDGSLITVNARGDEGGEAFDLIIDGVTVGSYTTTTSTQAFAFSAGQIVSADQVRIQFTNDVYDPSAGIDKNLIVDSISIDGVVFETEDPSVYSTGTWKPSDGIVPGYRESEWLHSGGYFQFAGGFDSPNTSGGIFDTDWVSNSLDVIVTPSNSLWLPNVDFSRDASGAPLGSGDRITDQFGSFGFTVSTNNPNKPAMIFDSSHPTGGDTDLGSPNSHFGGPGQGSGGQSSNDTSLGNTLIISEDNDASDPDDNAGGGVLIFEFDNPVMIDEIGLLDVQSGDNRIDLYDANGDLISSSPIADSGNNGYSRVELNALAVSRMEVVFSASGAITDVEFCRDGAPITPAQTRFFVVDRSDDDIYRYATSGSSLGDFDASAAYNPRGITTTGEGNPVWVISEEGSNERVYVYDTASGSNGGNSETLLGSWTAKGLTDPQGIATDGTDIWIVDRSTDKVHRYAGAASRLSGQQYAADSFGLAYGNQDARGITTDGQTIWTVDTASDLVFAYDMTGGFINWWELDADNQAPRGITINPAGGDGVWVVDGDDDAVYHYAMATLSYQGSQSAIGVFDLAPGNDHPEGIADPAILINFGDTVTDTISIAGEVDEWTFDAVTGTDIYLDFLSNTGGASTVTLTAPDGSVVRSRTSSSIYGLDFERLTLTHDGTYTITVTSAATPSYSFKLNEVVDDPTVPITLGEVVTGITDPIGQVDTYSFSADAGTKIFFDRLDVGGNTSIAQLTSPSGTNLFGSFTFLTDSSSARTLPETGQYELSITYYSGNLSPYSFQIFDVTDIPTRAIQLGDLVEDTIDVPGRQLDYTFSITQPADVVLDAVQTASGQTWRLTAPSGTVVTSPLVISDSNKLSLTEIGQYTLSVLPINSNIGDIAFIVWDSTNPDSIPVSVNTTVTELVAPQQDFTYEIDLITGQEFLFDVQSNDPAGTSVAFLSTFTLAAPDGSDVFVAATADQDYITAPATGTYTLSTASFNSGFRDLNGTYTWRIQERITPATSETADTVGGEFFLAAGNGNFAIIEPKLVLASTSDSVPAQATNDAAQVVIELPGLGWFHAVDVPAGETVVVPLPQDILLDRSNREDIDVKAIHVIADTEISTYVLLDAFASGDASTGIPVDALGTEYLVETFPPTCPLGCWASELSVVATEDDTIVTITPAIDAGLFSSTRPAGVAYDIFLDAGQTYQLQGGSFIGNADFTPNDLSGTEITSNKPIAVYGGNPETFVPDVGQADILVQQMPPVAAWGTRYVSIPLAGRTGGDTFRTMASVDGTNVSINGTIVATLNRGQKYETIIDGAAEFTADAPIMVTRFGHGGNFDSPDAANDPGAANDPAVTTGDPLMMTLVPTEQFDTGFVVRSESEGINDHYLSIVTFTEGIDAVTVDGIAVDPADFVAIGDGTYSGVTVSVAAGTHNIASGTPTSVEVYGYGNFDSYGYYAGSRISPVGKLAALTVNPATATLLPGDLHTVTASVVDQAGDPLADVRVDFSVTGTIAETFYAYSGDDGLVSFSYSSDNIGSDVVTAAVGNIAATADVNWLGAPPTVTVTSPAEGAVVTAGIPLIVSGRALPGPSQGRIVAVTINGRRVDSVDPSGNYFASVTPAEGSGVYEIEATDQFGQTASTTLTLSGETATAPFTLAASTDTTLAGLLGFSGTTFNRDTNVLHTDATLTATSPFGLSQATSVVIDPIDPQRVEPLPLAGEVGLSGPGEGPVLSFASQIPTTGLTQNQSSAPREIDFANPDRDRFSIDYRILSSENRAPVIGSAPITSAVIGQTYNYPVIATDADGDALSYRLLTGPQTAIVSTSGVVSFAATESDRGTHDVSIEVNDSRGGVSTQSFTLIASDAAPNRAPVFTVAPQISIPSGQDYDFTTTASDPDGDTVTFSLDSGPTGLSVNATSGQLTWTAPADGSYPVILRAADTSGSYSLQSFTLAVGAAGPVNRSPELFGNFSTTATVDSLYVDFPTATDADGDTLAFDLLSAPAGMAVTTISGNGNDARARIQYTPSVTDIGPQAVLLVVSDGNGGSATRSFTIDVAPVPAPLPPSFGSKPSLFATVGESYDYTAIASDLDGDSSAIVYSKISGPAGLTINSSTGVISYTAGAAELGDVNVTLQATDTDGLTATQSWTLSVRPANVAPVIESEPGLTVSAGARYRYDVIATDADDNVTYKLIDGPATMRISRNSGLLFWRPTLADIGDVNVIIRATDDRGLFDEQTYSLSVTADVTPPLANVFISNSPINVGENSRISVDTSDDVAVATRTLTIDGVEVPIDSQDGFTYTGTIPGIPDVVLTVEDTSGNVTVATLDPVLVVLGSLDPQDPSDTTPPIVDIQSPTSNATIEYLTDVVGSVSDENLSSYKLEYALLNTQQWNTIASRSVSGIGDDISLDQDVVGVFDPTLLQNNQYEIRLTASDLGGNVASDSVIVSLDGKAKVGVNERPAMDLVIPVAGGPSIIIGREHSQLTSDESGDFGNGWNYCMVDPDIRESQARTPFESLVGQFAALPMREGDRVYITTPSCERVGFTFSPVPHTGPWTVISDSFYDPRWIPDPGVDWELYGENDFTQITSLSTGEFSLDGLPLPLVRFGAGQYIIGGNSVSYNPLGYELINKQGVRYSYEQEAGLENVTDRNGNTLSYDENGFTSSSGQQVQFQRDDQGRITTVIDPDGNEIDYSYDDAGNLVDIQYPNGLSNSYRYTAENYLAAVNPEDLPEQESISVGFEYDVAGRLAVVFDALGATNSFSYDLDENTRITFDAFGAPTEMEYDNRGNMVREKSANDNEAFYGYDADDNLTSVTDERGFQTLMSYDDRRNMTSVTNASGGVTSITYNENNDLTQMLRPDGEVHIHTVDDAGNILRMQLPGGTDTIFEYDQRGRLIKATDVDGQVRRLEYGDLEYPIRDIERDGSEISFTYDVRGQITSITDENGNTTVTNVDARRRPTTYVDALGGITTFAYDGTQIASITDEVGDVTSFVYDGNDRPIRITDDDGGVFQTTYDANGRISTETDKNGNVTQYAYREDGRLVSITDAIGGVARYEYDASGNQTAVIDPNGNRWQWEYDGLNNVTVSIDPNGDRTEYEYDSMSNLTRMTDALGRVTQYVFGELNMPTQITNAAGDQMNLTYDWELNLLSESDENGDIHTYAYDQRNRLTRMEDPLGNVTQYAYDDVGNQTQATDSRGFVYTTQFDELNRPFRWTDPAGAVHLRQYDANSRLTSSTDPSGATTLFEYDGLDRIVKLTDPILGETTWVYDAQDNVTSSTDPLGRTTAYTFDDLNRAVSTTDPRGAVTTYVYDANGNRTGITDPVSNSTTYVYDSLNRIVQATDPFGNASTTVYDAVGNITSVLDRNGREISYAYDELDRLTVETWRQDASVSNTLNYSYDAVGNLLSAGDDFSNYAITYDAIHRATSVDNAGTPNVPNVVLNHQFDAASNRVAITDNLGVSVASTYDSRNQLSQRTWTGGGIDAATMTYGYDLRGLPTSLSRFAGTTTTDPILTTQYGFDAKSRLTTLDHLSGDGSSLVSYSYTRDVADQLIAESHHGTDYDYTRDLAGQVLTTSVDGNLTEDYDYDLNGNRTSGGSQTTTDNRLTQDDNYTYEYDAEGNLTRRTDRSNGAFTDYTFDHRNRLTLVESFASSGVVLSWTAYTYDVFDRMITRRHDSDGDGTIAATVRHSVYDGADIWADFDDDGNVAARYLLHDGTDQMAARWRPGEGTTWYLTDHLGTVRDLADADGDLVNEITYDSFGRILTQTDATVGDRFTFTGREWDEAVQLYYYRARFYDPVNGRFISQDPIRFAAGDANLYRYVGNNPLDYVDPSGNLALTECTIVQASSLALNMQCQAIRNLLNGKFEGKSLGEAASMTMSQVVLNYDFTTTDRNGKPLTGPELQARTVENTMGLLNTAASILPGGAGMAIQMVMKAITITTTAQSIAGVVANGQLFEVMNLADKWVQHGYALASDPRATFQQAVGALRDQSEVSRALMYTEIICGAGNLGLMVMAASSTCFVAGTPVVVGIQPTGPLPNRSSEQAAANRIAADGVTITDVIGGLALIGAVTLQQRRKKNQVPTTWVDDDTEDFSWMHAGESDDWRGIDNLQDQPVDEALLECLASDERDVTFNDELTETIKQAPLAPLAGSEAGGEWLTRNDPSPSKDLWGNGKTDTQSKKLKRPLAALIGCFLLALACLAPRLADFSSITSAVAASSVANVAESPQPQLITKPIEQIRCGDRIPSELPEGLEPEVEPEPDPATWRLVELTVEKKDGTIVEVKLLRPLAWLEQAGAIHNGHFDLAVEELGIEGRAAVLDIKPCPPIPVGDGQVVTGTFRHVCDDLVELRIEGEPEPIVCTSGHPIWSESSGSFVSASRLRSDENVLNFLGQKSSVEAVNRLSFSQRVFNFEVCQSHIYHVSKLGICVHNANRRCYDDDDDEYEVPGVRNPKSRRAGPKKPGRAGEMGNNFDENAFAEFIADSVGLDIAQKRRFHDQITGQGYTREDHTTLIEIAKAILKKET